MRSPFVIRVAIASMAAVVAFGSGLAVGMSRVSVGVPGAAAAVCQGAHNPCPLGDTTRTAVAEVTHADTTGQSIVYVEPNTGESWTVKAYWNTAAPTPCYEYTETASVDVDWQTLAAAWGTSNLTTTANIHSILVCRLGDCATPDEAHGWAYKLYADIEQTVMIGGVPYYLRQVVFTTTSVDNGRQVDTGLCSLGSSVSPTSQTFSVTDNGGAGDFECAFS